MNFDKFKSVLTLAVVSKENFVVKSVFGNIWHSSSVDVVLKEQLRRSKAAEKRSR